MKFTAISGYFLIGCGNFATATKLLLSSYNPIVDTNVVKYEPVGSVRE